MFIYFLRHASAGQRMSNLKKDEKRGLDKDPEVVRTMKQVMIRSLNGMKLDLSRPDGIERDVA